MDNTKIVKKIPNFLTIIRIIIIPTLVFAFYAPSMIANFIAAILFVVASITDYFDGYFARKLNAQTDFGKCLDPIADKLIVIVAIIMLINFSDKNLWILIPGLVIICREVLVSGLREFLSSMRVSIPVSKLAKYKTFVQMISITGLILGEKGSDYTLFYLIGNSIDVDIKFLIFTLIIDLSKFLFCIAAILTVVTGFVYLRIGFKNMKN